MAHLQTSKVMVVSGMLLMWLFAANAQATVVIDYVSGPNKRGNLPTEFDPLFGSVSYDETLATGSGLEYIDASTFSIGGIPICCNVTYPTPGIFNTFSLQVVLNDGEFVGFTGTVDYHWGDPIYSTGLQFGTGTEPGSSTGIAQLYRFWQGHVHYNAVIQPEGFTVVTQGVPEPYTPLLIGAGLLGLWWHRRRVESGRRTGSGIGRVVGLT